MAEGLLQKYAGDRFNVYSAGLNPDRIHPMVEPGHNPYDIHSGKNGEHRQGWGTREMWVVLDMRMVIWLNYQMLPADKRESENHGPQEPSQVRSPCQDH